MTPQLRPRDGPPNSRKKVRSWDRDRAIADLQDRVRTLELYTQAHERDLDQLKGRRLAV